MADAGREVQDLAARVCRRVEGAHRRQRRQYSIEHRTRWNDRRRVGREVVRRRVRMEFAGRGRAQLRLARPTRRVWQRVAADWQPGLHAGAAPPDRQPLRREERRERARCCCRATTATRVGTAITTGNPDRPAASRTSATSQTDIYLWGLEPGDLDRLPKRGWTGYLAPVAIRRIRWRRFQQGIEEIRRAAARLRADTTTPDFPPHATRGAGNNPVSTAALINLTLGRQRSERFGARPAAAAYAAPTLRPRSDAAPDFPRTSRRSSSASVRRA